MAARKIISIMTPCYNEQDGIRECYERVRDVLETRLPLYDFEHVFIDNCSQDATVRILKEIARTDPRVKIIVNSRNFGLSRSPYHGMLAATGDCVIPIVADLQTPPECIVEFVEKWEQGFKIVIAVRTGMEEGFVLKLLRSTFYRLLSRMSRVTQIQHFIGFGLFDRQVVNILRDLHEPDPYFRGLVSEIGFEKAFIHYHQPPRRHGKSRHSFLDLLELSMLALTTYSKVPIRMMTLGGLVIACGSIASAIVYFVLKIILWDSFPLGFAPLVIGTFFLSAINLLALGLVGEYVGLILQYSRKFPLVIEQERVNFVPSQAGSSSTPL